MVGCKTEKVLYRQSLLGLLLPLKITVLIRSSYSIYIGPWCDLSAPIRPPVTKAESYNIPILPTVSYVAKKKFGLKDCIR